MASEIGVDAQLMNEGTLLEDLGVDSLMQISILARLQGYVRATLPGSLLMECNTIAKLRVFFARQLPTKLDGPLPISGSGTEQPKGAQPVPIAAGLSCNNTKLLTIAAVGAMGDRWRRYTAP